MSLTKSAVSFRKLLLSPALIVFLVVGALASGIGIVFQGYETDTNTWFNSGDVQEILREPSGYTDNGGYASGIASAAGNYHARMVVDPSQCFQDGGAGAPANNDCQGTFTFWNAIYVTDGFATQGSNVITSATANFTAADVGLGVQLVSAFSPGTTILSVTDSTTAVASTYATENVNGGALDIDPLFSLGYITQADIYLDTAWAAGNPDWRFDWDSALEDNTQLNFLSDYVFNVGTQLSGDNTPGFWVSTSPNAFRKSTYPENPCPGPNNDGIGNYCRAPYKITTSGWYTFRHIFKIDPNSQNLSIEFQVLPLSGSPVVDQTIYGWQGNQQPPAGGISPAYGWFANMEIPELAVDNSLLKDFDTLALTPTNPGVVGAGTAQTFTLAASLFGVADPLTPGLIPANVTFTQGNGDTGTVTEVPSGTQPGNGTFSFVATGGTNGSVNLTANIDTAASNTVSFNVIQPALYSPANGSTLPGGTVTFQWTEYPGATKYWLDIGATQGSNNYYSSGNLGTALSTTAYTLPTNGSTVWARWYYNIAGSWQFTDYSYTAFGVVSPTKGVITSPAPNSILTGSSVTFVWSAGAGATAYWLDIGSSAGGNNYYSSGNLGNVLTVMVNGLPINGTTVNATLYSLINGSWQSNPYSYTAFSPVQGSPSPVSFLAAANYGADSQPYSVAVGDFNGDGKSDVAVANFAGNDVSVLLGNGDGTFATAVNYAVGNAPYSVAVRDFNGDGKPDLAVANYNSNTVSVLLGNDDGTFQAPVNYTVGTHPAGVAIGDVNGDGKPDLVVANQVSDNVSVLLGNGDGTFQAAANYAAGEDANAVAIGDVNGDGKPDLVVANYDGNNVSVLLGNGNGTFNTAVNYNTGSGPDGVAIADFNGDGKADLAVANYNSNNVSILLGNGDGTFVTAVNYAAGPGPAFVAVSDVNGDGKADLAVADGNSSATSVLLGNGDGTFAAATSFGVGLHPYWVAVGDFNGDGKPDLVTANSGSDNVSILLSNTTFSGLAMVFSPAPNSTLTGSSVTFQWTPSDPATAYWIDVGSAAGGNNYYSSGRIPTNTRSAAVSTLPTDGSTVYVTMYSLVNGTWLSNPYTYKAFSVAAAAAVMTSPTRGATLTGNSVTFTWSAGAGASAYWLDVGSSSGGNNYYSSGNLGNVLTVTVNGLPTDGSSVYATLYSLIGGQWVGNTYQYTALNAVYTLAVMQTPAPGSTVSGTTVTFTWSAGMGAAAYWIDISNIAPGGNELDSSGNLGNVLTATLGGQGTWPENNLPENGSTIYVTLYSYVGGQWVSNSYTYVSSLTFQGFETDTGDWDPTIDSNGDPITTTFRVPSGGGVLGLQAADGGYYAEVHNIDDDYMSGYYGDSGYTLFGYATQPPYPGDFSQSIKMYINANWPVALYGGPGVWIDETPGSPSNNYGAEHNFRLTPTGTSVEVYIDGQPSIATITTSGWYNFRMTFQKTGSCANQQQNTDLITTVMSVFDANGNVVGTPTTVCANSPGGPLNTEDLQGPGYIWITVWPDGWAGDVLGIDDARADLLH